MSTYFTKGIILKHQNWRDSDRIITIFSEDVGKFNAVAKGSRKISSKLAGSLEPFVISEFMIIKGRNFDTIAASEVINIFRSIRNDLKKIYIADYLCALVDSSTSTKQDDKKIYNLLGESLILLNNKSMDDIKTKLVTWYFIYRYLSYLGYQPEMYNCVSCQKKIIPDQNFFSINKGGLICNNCGENIDDKLSIKNNTIKIMRLINTASLTDLLKIKIDASIAKELSDYSNGFLNYNLEQELSFEKFSKPF